MKGLFRKVFLAFALITAAPAMLGLRLNLLDASNPRAREARSRLRSSALSAEGVLNDSVWTRRAAQKASDNFGRSSFDVVFSTHRPLGRALRRCGLADMWIADFRDVFDAGSYLASMRAVNNWYLRRDLKRADLVTAVSQGVAGALTAHRVGKRAAQRVRVLPNGFTPRTPAPPKANTDPGPLKLVYTGAVYDAQAGQIEALLRAVGEVCDEQRSIELLYAGRSGSVIDDVARECGVSRCVTNLGPVSHADALRLQESADALVVTSWNDAQRQGILTGKFLEYLGAERPVLALVAGSLPSSELLSVVAATKVGVCFEEASEGSELALREWLAEAADRRAEGKALPFQPDLAEVSRFNYETIAQRLLNLVSSAAVARAAGASRDEEPPL